MWWISVPASIERLGCEAFLHEQATARHVIRRHIGVGCAGRWRNRVAEFVDDVSTTAIALENAADESDVVVQHRENGMQPIVRGHVALRREASPQDRLTDVGNHDRVVQIVVAAVGVGQRLERHARALLEHAGLRLLRARKCLLEGRDEALHKGIDDSAGWAEHVAALVMPWLFDRGEFSGRFPPTMCTRAHFDR